VDPSDSSRKAWNSALSFDPDRPRFQRGHLVCDQRNITEGCGQDLAANRQNPAGLADPSIKAPRNSGQSGNEQVPERVAVELLAFQESVLEKLGE
jgi:hypothetical protein